MANQTTIKCSKQISRRLQIVSVLLNKRKEVLVSELLEQGLKPYEDKIKPLRFS